MTFAEGASHKPAAYNCTDEPRITTASSVLFSTLTTYVMCLSNTMHTGLGQVGSQCYLQTFEKTIQLTLTLFCRQRTDWRASALMCSGDPVIYIIGSQCISLAHKLQHTMQNNDDSHAMTGRLQIQACQRHWSLGTCHTAAAALPNTM